MNLMVTDCQPISVCSYSENLFGIRNLGRNKNIAILSFSGLIAVFFSGSFLQHLYLYGVLLSVRPRI